VSVAHDAVRESLALAFERVRWVLEDISDADCFWEPVTSCWSVRPRAEASRGWGTGAFVVEDQWPQPDPLPVTSIAWRIAHLAAWTDVYRNWTFEDQSLGLSHFDVPGNSVELVDWVVAAQQRFSACVDKLNDDDLADVRAAHYGAHLPVHRLVLGIANEHTHHGAEIGLLLDLRRGHARVQPPPRP
jgi:hypothetical protein